MASQDCLAVKVKEAFPDVTVKMIQVLVKKETLVLMDMSEREAKRDRQDHPDMMAQEAKWAKWVQEAV